MDVNSIIAAIQSTNNPALIYIGLALAVFVAAMLIRSILATVITVTGLALVVIVVLYLIGFDFSKIPLPQNIQLPDSIAKFFQKTDSSDAKESKDDSSSANPPTFSIRKPGSDNFTQSIKNQRLQGSGILPGTNLLNQNNSSTTKNNSSNNPLGGLFGN